LPVLLVNGIVPSSIARSARLAVPGLTALSHYPHLQNGGICLRS